MKQDCISITGSCSIGNRKAGLQAKVGAPYGETKKAQSRDKQGKSPDQDLPIDEYDQLTAGQVKHQLKELVHKKTRQTRQYERKHKNRKTVLSAMD